MLKFPGTVFLAAVWLLLAGCATPPPGPVPPEWPVPAHAAPPTAARTLPPPAVPVVPPKPAAQNAPPPKVSAPTLTWTSLGRWAAENHLPPPKRLAGSPVAAYAVTSPRGTLVLAIGTREAAWRGLEIHLGFAPESIDGEVFVHGLDLQKNLGPLLLGPPLAFGTNRVIVIDPGHGGPNPGAKCVLDNHNEKDFTLDWAKRLRPLLEADGWTVFLTRESDTLVTNALRAEFANARHADVFISLHFNSAAPDKKEGGLETFCLTPTGMPSTLTRSYSDLWTEHFPNNAFDAENLKLAVRLHASLLRGSGEEDRGVRRARFMDVLHGARCPAVLIEGGFLSNPHEAEKIESGEFRQRLAQAVADALR